jgi:hypothetical protein
MMAGKTAAQRYSIIVVGAGDIARCYPAVTANSEARIAGTYGVLALALGDGQYGWAFVDTSGTVRDRGLGACH